MAALLERRMERIDDVRYSLLPIGVVLGAIVGLVLPEPDLGTAVCIVVIAAVMVFSAGINYRYVTGLLPGVAARRLLPDHRPPTTAGVGCSRSSIPGPIRSATAGR